MCELWEANEPSQEGLLSEVWLILRANKRYWLIPLFAGLLLCGLLIVLGGWSCSTVHLHFVLASL